MLSGLPETIRTEGVAGTVAEAVELINETCPDLVFLDINLPDGLGFDVLQQIDYKDFRLIVTTAFEEFALRAIKFSAIDYLVKPYSPEELHAAIRKASQSLQEDLNHLRLNALAENISSLAGALRKIVLKTAESLHLVNVSDIIRCEADGPYTRVYLLNDKKLMVSKPLKELDQMLSGQGFIRLHQSHLVGFGHIERFDKAEGGTVVTKDGSRVPVASRKKESLLNTIDQLTRQIK